MFTLQEKLFPSLYIHWEKYQTGLLTTLKNSGEDVTLAGDGRHDSMGHSAKFCAYTTYCTNNSHIIDFSLVQVE